MEAAPFAAEPYRHTIIQFSTQPVNKSVSRNRVMLNFYTLSPAAAEYEAWQAQPDCSILASHTHRRQYTEAKVLAAQIQGLDALCLPAVTVANFGH